MTSINRPPLGATNFYWNGFKCFACDECEMVYASNSALSRHKRWHKGENPNHRFKCELCLYSTDSRKDFKRHGFIHSGERPFTCTLCGRGFTRNNHLKRHMLTHDASFPYTCNYCPKTFRRSDHLALHLQKHQENSEISVFAIPSPVNQYNREITLSDVLIEHE